MNFSDIFLGSTDDLSLLPEINTDDQEHHDTESDLFCHQIANNAIGDDGKRVHSPLENR